MYIFRGIICLRLLGKAFVIQLIVGDLMPPNTRIGNKVFRHKNVWKKNDFEGSQACHDDFFVFFSFVGEWRRNSLLSIYKQYWEKADHFRNKNTFILTSLKNIYRCPLTWESLFCNQNWSMKMSWIVGVEKKTYFWLVQF